MGWCGRFACRLYMPVADGPLLGFTGPPWVEICSRVNRWRRLVLMSIHRTQQQQNGRTDDGVISALICNTDLGFQAVE